MLEKIKQYQKSNRVYVVGFTNAGKSTMMNQLIYHYSDIDQKITTSMLPSTTLKEIEVPITSELTLIDTPGILEEGSILDRVDPKLLKKILRINNIENIRELKNYSTASYYTIPKLEKLLSEIIIEGGFSTQ